MLASLLHNLNVFKAVEEFTGTALRPQGEPFQPPLPLQILRYKKILKYCVIQMLDFQGSVFLLDRFLFPRRFVSIVFLICFGGF